VFAHPVIFSPAALHNLPTKSMPISKSPGFSSKQDSMSASKKSQWIVNHKLSRTLKGLSYEIDFKNFDKNLENLA
jgi:hypothetical protein